MPPRVNSAAMPWLAHSLHHAFVADRRRDVLAGAMSALLPAEGDILDVGCGDGAIGALLRRGHPRRLVTGLETTLRPGSAIPVQRFDGASLPVADDAHAAVVFCDVLHHAADAAALLREARRVAPVVVIKDHFAKGRIDRATLTWMEPFGNPAELAPATHYRSEAEWTALWRSVGLAIGAPLVRHLGLYPTPLAWCCERTLHFVVRLERVDAS